MSRRVSQNLFLAVVFAVSVLAFLQAGQLRPPQFEPIGAAFFPRATVAVLLVLIVVSIFVCEAESMEPRAGLNIKVVAGVALPVLYTLVLLSESVGFALASAVFLCAVAYLFRERLPNLVAAIIISVVISAMLELIFSSVFLLNLKPTLNL